MELTPDSSPAKSSRAQPKPGAAKKPRAARKSPTAPVAAATPEPAPEHVASMIATAAYYLAAARNFSPGHELDDWLEAERAVHARLYG